MLRIDSLKLPLGAADAALRRAAAHALRTHEGNIRTCRLLRRSLDARDGVMWVCSAAVEVENEAAALKNCRNKNVMRYVPERYTLPGRVKTPEVRPVVVGAGS